MLTLNKVPTARSRNATFEGVKVGNRRRSERGIALLTEILVALAVLIPVMTIVGGMFTYSFSVDRRAWNQRTAQSLARSALEQVRGLDFQEMASSSSVWPPDTMPAAERAKLPSAGTAFKIEVTVTPDGPVEDSVVERQLVSIVTWSGNNREEKVRLETSAARVFQRINQP